MGNPDRYVEHAHRLWDELADRPIGHAEEALRYLLDQTCKLLGANNASWLGVIRMAGDFADDPLSGWRLRVASLLHPSAEQIERAREDTKKMEQGDVDVTTLRQLAGVGAYRVNRLVDLVPPEWFESAYYHWRYTSIGRHDAMWAVTPINPDAECYFGIFRGPNTPRFTAEERDAFGYILRGLKWFHRRQMLSHGLLIAETPLTPTEKKVLHGLLLGRSEKEIAAQIGQSYNTTHEHVGTIYRKFAVNNRSALMSLWIGGRSNPSNSSDMSDESDNSRGGTMSF